MASRKKTSETEGKPRRDFGRIFRRDGRRGLYLAWRWQGRRFKAFAGLTEDEAKEFASDLWLKLRRGEDPREKPDRLEPILFEKFAREHLATLKTEHKASTYADERNKIENFLIPAFRGKRVHEVTTAQVEKFLADRVRAKNSPATRNRFRNVLSVLFGRAVKYGFANLNPVDTVVRLKEQERPIPALSHAEQQLLLDSCAPRIYNLALMALDTGMRKGELLGLEWPDVDTEVGTITVRKSKSAKTRNIPLTSRLLARLKDMRAARTVPLHGRDRVFSHIAETWSGPTAKLFKRAAAAAGFPDLRFHDCRHLFAVSLVRAQVPIPDVGALLGHGKNSIAVTMRYAAHMPENAGTRARDLLEAARAGTPSGTPTENEKTGTL